MVKIRMTAKTRMAIAGAAKAAMGLLLWTAGAPAAVVRSPDFRADCAATQAGWKAPFAGVRSRNARPEREAWQRWCSVTGPNRSSRSRSGRSCMMLIVLGLTAAVAVLLFPTIAQIFLASPYLKIFIVFVFRRSASPPASGRCSR